MNNLELILRKLKDVNFVTRPLEQEEAALPQPQEEAMSAFNPTPQPNPANKVLNQNALNNFSSLADLGQMGDTTPPPEPVDTLTNTQFPTSKKLKFLNDMNQRQKLRGTPLKPLNTLTGGDNSGFGI